MERVSDPKQPPIAAKPSKHALDGDIIVVHSGIAIYKTHASPYWYARIRDPQARKYVVRSTKETSRLKARNVAEELAPAQPEHQLVLHIQRLALQYAGEHFAQGDYTVRDIGRQSRHRPLKMVARARIGRWPRAGNVRQRCTVRRGQ